MRVAVFFFSFAPHVNGVVTVYERVLAALAARGVALELYVPPGSAATHPAGRVVVCPGFPLPTAPGYHVPFAPRDLAARLTAFAPDVVHVIDPWSLNPLGNVALATAGALGIPRVVAFHTHHARYARGHGVAVPLDFIERLEALRCARSELVLAASDEARANLARLGAGPARWWRGGVDTDLFRPEAADPALRERLLGERRDARLVVAVGRLAPEKNLAFVCELARRREDLVLAIAGEGSERASLERRLPKGRGHLLGNLPQAALASLYASADVHVVASRSEVQGLTIIESLACGTPVVAAAAGGLPESVRAGIDGECVPPDDSEAFLAAIDRWSPPTPAQRARCREGALAWRWDVIIDELLAAYREVAAARRPLARRPSAAGPSVVRAIEAASQWTMRRVPIVFHRAAWRYLLRARAAG